MAAFTCREFTFSIFSRITVFSTILLLSASLFGGCGERKTAHERPNVVLVVLDTARADYFSCYGHPRPTTPFIDKIASEGVRFDRAYTTDSWTLPAHASLFTGLYPTEARSTSETNHLPRDVTTVAELLGRSGYRTGAVVCNAWISLERGFGQGFTDFYEMWRKEEQAGTDAVPGMTEERAVEKAVGWIERVSGHEPFFLFINYNVPHLPYRPTREYWLRFASRDWPMERLTRLLGIVGMWPYLAGAVTLDQTDFSIMRELYEAEIAIADEQTEHLVRALRRKGVLDNTLLIITSDHGENIGDHGRIDHLLSMHETALRVPLIIRYPERFRQGTVNEDLISLIDIVPTILDVCRLPESSLFPGRERMSLCSSDRLERYFVVAENDRPMNGVRLMQKNYPSFDISTIDFRMRAVRGERYKLIWEEDHGVELFDLISDPLETSDISSTSPLIRDKMLEQLRKWMTGVESGGTEKAFESGDEESLEWLRSLGYVE